MSQYSEKGKRKKKKRNSCVDSPCVPQQSKLFLSFIGTLRAMDKEEHSRCCPYRGAIQAFVEMMPLLSQFQAGLMAEDSVLDAVPSPFGFQ